MTAENPAFGPVVPDKERSIPPLDQHLQKLSIEKTRIGKVYDFILGEMIIHFTGDSVSFGRGGVRMHSPSIIQLLVATEAYHELPNRKRLVELVEKAMPKEGAK